MKISQAGGDAAFPHLPRAVVVLWIALFTVRAVAAFLGLDRLPLLPTVPAEVLLDDPAWALSRGLGLVAPSFVHSFHGFDRMYDHFPPVFIVLQALAFRLLGLSAFTLRGVGGINGLLAFAVFLAVFRELYRQGILDCPGLAIGSSLLLLEPTTLIQCREGRMESTNVLFGALALYCTVRASRAARHEGLLWVAAALLSGLSLATHPSGMLFVPALAGWSLFRFRRYGIWRWLAVNALPLGVFAAVWIAAYGTKSVEALRNMQQLTVYNSPPTLGLSLLAGVIRRRAPAALQETGSFALVALVIAPAVGAVRYLAVMFRRPRTEREQFVQPPDRWLILLAGASAVVAVQCSLIAFVLPWSGANRIVMAAPFAFLCVAIALSWLPRAALKRAFAAAALAVLLETVILGGYLAQLRFGGVQSGPDRFDAIVDSIPPDARVAAVPEFWFAFHHRGRSFAMLYHMLDENRYWNQAPGAFDPYDVVILDPVDGDYRNLLARARPGRPVERIVHTWRRDFTILERAQWAAPDGNPTN